MLTTLLWFIYRDTDNIFSSGKLLCLLEGEGFRELAEVVWMVSADSWQAGLPGFDRCAGW